jgi:hypothetical protein
MSKKTKEPPKRPNHKGNIIKFPNPSSSRNPLLLQEAYQIRKGEDFLKEKDMRRIQNKRKELRVYINTKQIFTFITCPIVDTKCFTLVTYRVNPLTTFTSHYLAPM